MLHLKASFLTLLLTHTLSVSISAEERLAFVESVTGTKNTYEEVEARRPFVQLHATNFFYTDKINAGQYRSHVSIHRSFQITDPEKIEGLIFHEIRRDSLVQFVAKIASGREKSIIKEILITPVSEVGEIDNGSKRFKSGKSSLCHRHYDLKLLDGDGRETRKVLSSKDEIVYVFDEESAGCSELIRFLSSKKAGLGLSPG